MGSSTAKSGKWLPRNSVSRMPPYCTMGGLDFRYTRGVPKLGNDKQKPWLPSTGGSFDWVKASTGIKYCYTLECRPDSPRPGFLLPASGIIPSGEETWAGVKYIAKFLIDKYGWFSYKEENTDCWVFDRHYKPKPSSLLTNVYWWPKLKKRSN